MKSNVGKIDRAMRIILGLVVIAVGLYFKNWFGALGLIFILTGIFSFCPLYKVLGNMNTCSTKKE